MDEGKPLAPSHVTGWIAYDPQYLDLKLWWKCLTDQANHPWDPHFFAHRQYLSEGGKLDPKHVRRGWPKCLFRLKRTPALLAVVENTDFKLYLTDEVISFQVDDPEATMATLRAIVDVQSAREPQTEGEPHAPID
jgi:hypothetical protein